MKKILIALALLVTSLSPTVAYDETARAEERADLLEALKAAPNEKVARAAAKAIWDLWQTAPDEKAQTLLDKSRNRLTNYDFAGAVTHLDELVAYAPDYAEGWNTRATVLFLQEKYDRSLDDIEKTLELEPAHFGSLAGKAMILLRQGRAELGYAALRQAVEIHPYLNERGLLPKKPK